MIIKAKVIGIRRVGEYREVEIATSLDDDSVKYSSFIFRSQEFSLDDQVDVEITLMQTPETIQGRPPRGRFSVR